MRKISYARHRFPPEIIRHSVWLYFPFPLSYRDVEDLLAERGIDVSYETVRRWALKFEQAYAAKQKMRPCLDHGVLELDNNSAERSMRCVALGRKNYLFMGSESGGKSAAIIFTLIETAKLNGIDPQAWLTETIARIADHKITRIDELLPWRYAASAA
jgi:hypothetical protein